MASILGGKIDNKEEAEDLLDRLIGCDLSSSTEDFLDSLRDRLETHGYLTERQLDALRSIADRENV